MLANKLIEKGAVNEAQKLRSNILITEKDIGNYVKQKVNANMSREGGSP